MTNCNKFAINGSINVRRDEEKLFRLSQTKASVVGKQTYNLSLCAFLRFFNDTNDTIIVFDR